MYERNRAREKPVGEEPVGEEPGSKKWWKTSIFPGNPTRQKASGLLRMHHWRDSRQERLHHEGERKKGRGQHYTGTDRRECENVRHFN